MTDSIIRRATGSDLEPLTAYIALANSEPGRQCLHTPGFDRRAIRQALLGGGGLAAGRGFVFVVASDPALEEGGGITGAIGCQISPNSDLGWLWGPWTSAPAGWKDQAPALLHELLRHLPAAIRRLDGFLSIANADGLDFLAHAGFSIRPATHIYVAAAQARNVWESEARLPELKARHEAGFARLHRESFPAAGSTPAAELLSGRDNEHVIFAAAADLRLDGYVCVSVNAAPCEGFIEYLAVRPAARGRGIGQRLLRTALHWTFARQRLPQAALCVTDWRDDARRLYERAGFRLSATGRGARRQLRWPGE